MCTLRRFAIVLCSVALSFSLSAAQEGKTATTAQPSTLTVTASAAPNGVRFAVLGEAAEPRNYQRPLPCHLTARSCI